jgi:Na+/H+-dicarboxylate symporter
MTDARETTPAVFSLNITSLAQLSDRLGMLVRGRLWLQVLIGMALGIVTGILLGPSTGWLTPRAAQIVGNWLALPGQLFLTLIQMIVIPLVFASVIRGLAASENLEQLRKVGLRVTLYFLVTTAIAIVIGLQAALLIEPGNFIDRDMVQSIVSTAQLPAAADDLARPDAADIPAKLAHLLPRNPLTSMVEGEMLQVVLFAVIFGVALVMMAPDQARPLLDLLGSLQEVCMTVVRWAMLLAPIAVFGLLAQLTSKIGLDALLGMAVYVGTVLLGLATLFGLYLLLLWSLGGMGPRRFLGAARDALLLAFSTSSSAAVMPLSMKTAEERLGVRSSVAQFVIPLGATINMNGTALYQGVAAIFLAQVFGIDLSIGAMALIVVTAVGASVGSPATPGVGIVILAMVLDSVGIPPAGIALIMGVDRILDMARTAINVCGDLVAARIMDRWLGESSEDATLTSVQAETVRTDTD